MKLRSPIKVSPHLTRLIRIYDEMVRKIPLAIGNLAWIMRFDGNDIAFPLMSSLIVSAYLSRNSGSLLNFLSNVLNWASDLIVFC